MGAAAFTICETFSSKVIRETRSSTRFSIGSEGSLYGGMASCPLAPVCGAASDKAISRNNTQIKPQRERFISPPAICYTGFQMYEDCQPPQVTENTEKSSCPLCALCSLWLFIHMKTAIEANIQPEPH